MENHPNERIKLACSIGENKIMCSTWSNTDYGTRIYIVALDSTHTLSLSSKGSVRSLNLPISGCIPYTLTSIGQNEIIFTCSELWLRTPGAPVGMYKGKLSKGMSTISWDLVSIPAQWSLK